MKLKQQIASLLAVVSLSLYSLPGMAAWYTCSVQNTGATTTAIRIRLTDDAGAFSNRWFEVAPAREKETMATALTAMAAGKKLLVQLNSTAAFSEIAGAYLEQ